MPPSPVPVSSRRELFIVRQAARRQREHRVRKAAVQICQQVKSSCSQVARELGIHPRTLCHWKQSQEQGTCQPLPVGRPPKEPSISQVHETWNLLKQQGPLSIPTLRAELDLPRCVAVHVRHEYRDWHRAKYRRGQQRLTWLRPGSVWAIDHTEPAEAVDQRYPYILSVRDLASGYELAWQAVPDFSAKTTLAIMEELFRRHGAPLLAKSDNGPSFKSDDWALRLAAWNVVPLLSPPYAPWYNGACEAGIQAQQKRTDFFAAKHGHPCWTTGDLAAARHQANCIHRPEDRPHATAAQVWDDRAVPSADDRAHFAWALDEQRAALRAKQREEDRHDARQNAKLERDTVRRALVELGLLSVTWRSIPLPITPAKLANFM